MTPAGLGYHHGMKNICVYCGSSPGKSEAYCDAARSLGKLLAAREIGLIYGAASVGVMGALADATLAAGGEVVGVIPEALMSFEISHDNLTELVVVDSMHTRKATMAERADAFIALPGGLGTLEELFEMLTWSQLRFHAKPVGLLNVDGFYDSLLAFLDQTVAHEFVRQEHRDNLIVSDDPEALLAALSNWQPPTIDKWWERD